MWWWPCLHRLEDDVLACHVVKMLCIRNRRSHVNQFDTSSDFFLLIHASAHYSLDRFNQSITIIFIIANKRQRDCACRYYTFANREYKAT